MKINTLQEWIVYEEQLEDNSLIEKKIITYKNSPFPNEGWAVIMAGGPGVGKSWIVNHNILIDGKVFDVDKLKQLAVYASERNKSGLGKGNIELDRRFDITKTHDEEKHQIKWDVDLTDADDTGYLHAYNKANRFPQRQRNAFFNGLLNSKTGRLPNIIFDVTGKEYTDWDEYLPALKSIGYKILVVWVVVNRDIAIDRNLERPRKVPADTFHSIHNAVNLVIPEILRKKKYTQYIDSAWVLLNEKDNEQAISLDRNSNGIFDIDIDYIMDFAGENEPDPSNPQKYRTWS